MYYLYHGGGDGIKEIRGPLVSDDEWRKTKTAAVRLLAARRQTAAASLLTRYPFEWVDATNYFSDEFSALQAVVPLDERRTPSRTAISIRIFPPSRSRVRLMIANLLDILATPRSARLVRGRMSGRRISDTFDAIRIELAARTLHTQIRVLDNDSRVTWSVWVGRFEKPVTWLVADRFNEIRYAFALILERSGFVGVLGSNIGDVGAQVSDDAVSYQKLLALHSDTTTEIESISTRTLRAARFGVQRSTQSGRHLEKSLSRVGANQAAPFQLSIRHADQAWRISPSSGRVTTAGARSTIPELCSWFASTCSGIEQATEPSDFIKAFAHPVALGDLPVDVVPVALQLDSSVIDDVIELGGVLHRDDAPINDDAIEELRQLVRELWLVDPVRSRADEQAKTWRLMVGRNEVGHLSVRSSKISLTSSPLADVKVVNEDGTSVSLNHVFNSGSQPLRLTFSDVSYAYAAGHLFRDHRLLGSRSALLEILSDRLPATATNEKGFENGHFTPDSLFGFVAEQASVNDDFLVCDDIGTEWADFIGISAARHEITFYHCKGGQVDVGASDLHEVVAQAAKNLGYLTATRAELDDRTAKWEGSWNKTIVPRLQRGGSVDDFVAAFAKAVVAPQATRRITLVTSSLSKSAVAAAFSELTNGPPRPEPLHVLWLLLVFVDQCRGIGAVPEIICRP